MDQSRFDDITRVLAAPSRRSLLSIAGAAALAAMLGWDGQQAGAGPNKKKKKKKKKKPCTQNCVGKVCGETNGCGGFCTDCPQGKSCVNKQCIDDTCSPDCDGKDCGAADGCGGKCTRQQGCGANQTCINGGCVTTSCRQDCTTVGQHCCDPLGFGTFGCWNCCDDQHCVDNAVFRERGQVVCRTGGCDCPDDQPALCPAGFGTAAHQCTDPRSDKRNCGPLTDPPSCGSPCPNHPDHECCDGTCVFLPKCIAGGSSAECQTPHCGTCGTPCEDEGFGCCNGSCVDMTQDPNCGACGADCSSIGSFCEGGICHECECEEE